MFSVFLLDLYFLISVKSRASEAFQCVGIDAELLLMAANVISSLCLIQPDCGVTAQILRTQMHN